MLTWGTVDTLIDLHAHVLPGIDDGPADVDGSLALLRVAAASRTRLIVATPHLRADFPAVCVEHIAAACADLQDRVPPEWNLRIVPGGEVDLTWAMDADDEQLEMASFGGRGTDLLVETPYGRLGDDFEQRIDEVAARGFRVLLAHPEMSQSLQRRPKRILALVDRGVLLQITATSLLRDRRRSKSARLAQWLVEHGLAHVIASDAHSGGAWRPPGLMQALRAARELAPGRAMSMVNETPAAILAGDQIVAASPVG